MILRFLDRENLAEWNHLFDGTIHPDWRELEIRPPIETDFAPRAGDFVMLPDDEHNGLMYPVDRVIASYQHDGSVEVHVWLRDPEQ